MTSHPRDYKLCPQCGQMKLTDRRNTYCSNRCSAIAKSLGRGTGEEAAHWKGEAIGYMGQHHRVYKARGKASAHTCKCGKPATDWANLTGNYLDTDDFEAMCKACHNRFDREKRTA